VHYPSTSLIDHFTIFHVVRDDFGTCLTQSKPEKITNTKNGLFDLIDFHMILTVGFGVHIVFEKLEPYFLGKRSLGFERFHRLI
jgi:hypothetical protein